ncbi:hypothetical protein U9M48_031736 [Paspalum notatum var. saurae]|uniref:Uncharacterized protein n=1 Tax=Paspalum notatum var. saurae TaxID=547442 RepID=A0AAQ3X512_PASNO
MSYHYLRRPYLPPDASPTARRLPRRRVPRRAATVVAPRTFNSVDFDHFGRRAWRAANAGAEQLSFEARQVLDLPEAHVGLSRCPCAHRAGVSLLLRQFLLQLAKGSDSLCPLSISSCVTCSGSNLWLIWVIYCLDCEDFPLPCLLCSTFTWIR